MKGIFKGVIFAAVLILCFNTAFSQPKDKGNRKDNNHRPTKEMFMQIQLQDIQKELMLSRDQMLIFEPIYKQYKKDKHANMKDQKQLAQIDVDSLSISAAEELLQNRSKVNHAMLNLQDKYALEFRKILDSKQLLKLYQIEAKTRKKLMGESKKRQIRQ